MIQIAALLLFSFTFTGAVIQQQPEQVHLSLGADSSQMIATWVTMDELDYPPVGEYGLTFRILDKNVTGYSTRFVDGGSENRTMFIHRVTMIGLEPGTLYFYRVGSERGWSEVFWFKTIYDHPNWSPRVIVFGDLGNKNGRSIPRLQREIESGSQDIVLHNGDFAYNLDSDNARVGDQFMRQIEPIAAYVPYQTSVGNHEMAYNFSNYVNRFTMVNSGSGEMNNHFYAFNLGPARVIVFSTEFYFFFEYGWSQMMVQYNWIEQQLIEANKIENRSQRPWLIVMAHRPMYCSTKDDDDCTFRESIIRKGLPIIHSFGLEEIFRDYGVDLELYAHEHMYERLWPIYDYKVLNGSFDKPYTNPGGPVHLIAGSAGCQENLDPFVDPPGDWSAKRISDYGFARMVLQNKTHLHISQISDELGTVVDEIQMVKDSHMAPYPIYQKKGLPSDYKIKQRIVKT